MKCFRNGLKGVISEYCFKINLFSFYVIQRKLFMEENCCDINYLFLDIFGLDIQLYEFYMFDIIEQLLFFLEDFLVYYSEDVSRRVSMIFYIVKFVIFC